MISAALHSDSESVSEMSEMSLGSLPVPDDWPLSADVLLVLSLSTSLNMHVTWMIGEVKGKSLITGRVATEQQTFRSS